MNCDTWPIPEGDCAGGCTIPDGTDAELVEAASIQAGLILHTLSGNQIGQCVDNLRPLNGCGCRSTCYCDGDRLRLYSPSGPVTGIESIYVDGELLAESEYRFYPSSQLLYRLPPAVWPTGDDKTLDCDEAGAFCVNALVGYEPDAWAVAVHAELTCEILKSCTDQKCRIPKNATQVTGQGVTVTLSATELNQFIPAVAAWVAAVNPDKMRQPATVSSPDLDNSCGGGGGVPYSPSWGIDGGWA
jgi:hypothetical protein